MQPPPRTARLIASVRRVLLSAAVPGDRWNVISVRDSVVVNVRPREDDPVLSAHETTTRLRHDPRRVDHVRARPRVEDRGCNPMAGFGNGKDTRDGEGPTNEPSCGPLGVAFDTRPEKTGATQAERIESSLAQHTRAARVRVSG